MHVVASRSKIFTSEIDRVVNDLKSNAHWLEETLTTMGERSSVMLEQADQVFISQQNMLMQNENLRKTFETGINGLTSMAKEAKNQIEVHKSILVLWIVLWKIFIQYKQNSA